MYVMFISCHHAYQPKPTQINMTKPPKMSSNNPNRMIQQMLCNNRTAITGRVILTVKRDGGPICSGMVGKGNNIVNKYVRSYRKQEK
mmetsp:Transcript_49903/g.129520  ORF Transcript_49903/g.129520 Transcript_49903/m.129520 type:complete len:87 (-) Transcript_49903:77-337(-)